MSTSATQTVPPPLSEEQILGMLLAEIMRFGVGPDRSQAIADYGAFLDAVRPRKDTDGTHAHKLDQAIQVIGQLVEIEENRQRKQGAETEGMFPVSFVGPEGIMSHPAWMGTVAINALRACGITVNT